MKIRRAFVIIVILFAGLISRALVAQDDTERFGKLIAQTKSESADEQIDAFLKLVEFPEHADKLLIPLVEAMITGRAVGEAAQFAAEQIGPAMAKHCDSALDSEDRKEFAAAAEMIHRLGDVAIGSTPKLVALTRSQDPKRRLSGIYGLVTLKNSDASVIDAIEPFLDDPDFRLQVLACRAIVTIGPPAARLNGKLKTLVEKGNVSSRSHALIALGAIGPNKDFDVVELLAKHLDAYLQPDRDRALIGLTLLGPHAAAAKGKVEALMNDEEKFVQCQAALALWKITGDAETSVKALVAMSKTNNLQYEALMAIYQMKADAVSAAKDVAEMLQNEDGSIRSLSAEILENLGSVAQPWQATLEKLAKEDPDPMVRFHCARAAKKLLAVK